MTRYQQRQARRAAGSPRAEPHLRSSQLAIRAPKNLSIVDNPSGTAQFFSKIHENAHGIRPIHISARHVKKVSSDGLTALLAIVHECRCVIGGDLPLDPSAAAVFKNSGIFNQLAHRWRDVPPDGALFRKRSGVGAQGELAEECISFATHRLGRPGGRLLGVYRVLLECMANTANHAKGVSDAIEPWYLHTYHDARRGVVRFTFLDYGVGIVRSLVLRGVRKVTHEMGLGHHGSTLRAAFDGEFPSRTGRINRGLGLHGIKKVMERGQISRLVSVANRGYVNLTTGETRRLPASFPGTLIYWEVEASHVLPPAPPPSTVSSRPT